jgi:hypothetical protein
VARTSGYLSFAVYTDRVYREPCVCLTINIGLHLIEQCAYKWHPKKLCCALPIPFLCLVGDQSTETLVAYPSLDPTQAGAMCTGLPFFLLMIHYYVYRVGRYQSR